MAGADVIRDTGETLAALLREGIPEWLVPPQRIRVAGCADFLHLPVLEHATVTVCLYRAEVRYKLRATSQDRGLPLALSYLVTPWAMDAGEEHALLGRIVQVIDRGTVVPPEQRTGDSWESGDTVQFLIEDLPRAEECGLWEAMRLPFRPSVPCQAQVFALDGAGPD